MIVKTRAEHLNVMVVVKGKERYVFVFDDTHRQEAIGTAHRFAGDPGLSFGCADAALFEEAAAGGDGSDTHPPAQ